MDAGRPQTSRPGERVVINKQDPVANRQAAQYAKDARSYQNAAQRRRRRPLRKVLSTLAIIIGVVVLVGAGWLVWSRVISPATAVDSSKYQVVFLTNGQFYFGKLQSLNGDYLKLTNVYYLQTENTDSSNGTASQSATDGNYKLIKLGDEIHGPEDAMLISNRQVLYYENLKPDGKVAQLIAQNNAK